MKRYIFLGLILSILLWIGWNAYMDHVQDELEKRKAEATATSTVTPQRMPEMRGNLWILP